MLTREQKTTLREAWYWIEKGDSRRANSLLITLPATLKQVQNMRGVILLRYGNTKSAIEIFRELVPPGDASAMDGSCPVAWQANYAVALLLSGDVKGFMTNVLRIQPRDHPLAKRLREAAGRWEASLSGWAKWKWKIIGSVSSPSLKLDLTPGWAEDYLTGGVESREIKAMPARPAVSSPPAQEKQGELRSQGHPETSAAPVESCFRASGSAPAEPDSEESDAGLQEYQAKHTGTIRVFVSSTFHDMQEERRQLDRVFSEIRKICRKRGVEFVAVDLRWGITPQQAQRKETLRLCLKEVEKCRPFFIGILGERYGWVPGNKGYDVELLREHPWIEGLKDSSATELEILHAVLNDPEAAARAFFYFRDPAYAPPDSASYPTENEASRERQQILKERIRVVCREKGIPLREDYATPQELAFFVLQDLKEAITMDLPRGGQLDALTREARDHETFAEGRRKIYIERKEYFQRLDAPAAGGDDAGALLVVGEPGSGKTALLANWAAAWRLKHPEDHIFQHYVGTTAQGGDLAGLARRLTSEIRSWIGETEGASSTGAEPRRIGREAPAGSQETPAMLPYWLGNAGRHARRKGMRFIIVLDALDRLGQGVSGRHLWWLPKSMPAGVRLVVSTLPGHTLDVLQDRGWASLKVEPLVDGERRLLVTKYLALFGKALEAGQADRIVSAPAASNPLYLRLLLDELRIGGVHERLGELIGECLQAKGVQEIYARVLLRLDRDSVDERPGLVRELLSFVRAARRGLTEPEIMELLSLDGAGKLPAALWARLRSDLDEVLAERGGILNLADDYVRQTVEGRFIQGESDARRLRVRLADYFEAREVDARQADELPWLLMMSEERERLRRCLPDIDRFLLMHKADPVELMQYWLFLGMEGMMGNAYLAAYRQWAETSRGKARESVAANELGLFLYGAGCHKPAERLFRRALEINENSLGKQHPEVARNLNNLAVLLRATNRLAEAEPLFRRALEINENSLGKEHPNVATNLNNLAELLRVTNRLAEAEPLFRRALEINENSLGKEHPNVASTLNNLALLLRVTNRLARAEHLFRHALEINENSLGKEHPNVATNLNNLALLLRVTNRLEEAEHLFRRALEIDENSLGKEHPNVALTLYNMADLLRVANRLEEAEHLYRRALEINENSLGKGHPNVALTLNNLAELLRVTNRLEEAEHLFRRALEINENSFGKEHPEVATNLNNLALSLRATNRLEEAEPLFRRALGIWYKFSRTTGRLLPYLQMVRDNYVGLLEQTGLNQEEIRARLHEMAPEYF